MNRTAHPRHGRVCNDIKCVSETPAVLDFCLSTGYIIPRTCGLIQYRLP